MTELKIETEVDIGPYCALAIPAKVKAFTKVGSREELEQAAGYARENDLRIFALGHGTNIVMGADYFDGLVLKMELTGIEIEEETKQSTLVRAAAGEEWDTLVRWAVERDLAGIESLSIVPGTVGAAPVQNVGCYGQELSDTLESLEAFDLVQGKFVTLSAAECEFGYRTSMFKKKGRGRYIVTQVLLRLQPAHLAPIPTYETLQSALASRRITGRPTLEQLRESVISVRRSKLPDPKKIPTVGSFFHSAIITPEHFARIQKDYPNAAHYPEPDGMVKVPAGWLTQRAGLKGYYADGVGMYEKHALALVNPGRKSAKEVLAFADYVNDEVEKKFGIRLSIEPEVVT